MIKERYIHIHNYIGHILIFRKGRYTEMGIPFQIAIIHIMFASATNLQSLVSQWCLIPNVYQEAYTKPIDFILVFVLCQPFINLTIVPKCDKKDLKI